MNLNQMARQGAPAQDPTVGSTGGGQPASARQQAQFDMLLGRARQMMGEQAQAWREAMDIDPAQAAVRMGTQTLRYLAQQSEKAGQPVDPAVLLHVGVQFVKDIAGLANDAGMVPDEQLEPFLQQVMQESIAEYMRMDADDGLMPAPPRGAGPARVAPTARQQGGVR
ncbi:hypothetical protein [Acidovorax sp.]|uniref:hypothetical protein n=1 Tax=Acidovorax sp. TaxID=1872122 RepID=UPI002ACE870F|nr:hypothetical protein [Acidovorax sp.]MDZ7863180.1 hypothetical protein [Acidovorax sp.]